MGLLLSHPHDGSFQSLMGGPQFLNERLSIYSLMAFAPPPFCCGFNNLSGIQCRISILGFDFLRTLTPLIHRLPQHCAGLEGQDPPSGNHYFLSRFRVSSFSGPLLAGDEIPKSGDFYLFSLFQGLLEDLEYPLYDLKRFLPRETGFFFDNRNKFRFRYCHGSLPKNKAARAGRIILLNFPFSFFRFSHESSAPVFAPTRPPSSLCDIPSFSRDGESFPGCKAGSLYFLRGGR